jgi:PRTRC genetic system ThiF family protein
MVKVREKAEPAGVDLDLSHLQAVPLKLASLGQHHTLRLYLVGCGGTGSWLAPHIVRLARFLREAKSTNVQVTFIDPDTVEAKNVFRQNFSSAEIGARKAETLALRLGPAWGTEVRVHTRCFDPKMVELGYGDVGVLIGCVDNAAARQTIANALDHGPHGWGGGWSSGDSLPLPHLFWLDCGNGQNTGQVLLGSTSNFKMLRSAFPHFPEATFCIQLPAPHLQHPDLLELRPNEVKATGEPPAPSCAQLVFTGDQSPSINAMVANIAATYLWRMFTDPKGLTTFASYCNLEALSVRSRFITPETMSDVFGKPVTWFEHNRSSNLAW